MQGPKITTAIPRKRYELGPYGVVVLGEVESPDPITYLHILALVPEGASDPHVYVTCERTAGGDTRFRVIAEGVDQVLPLAEACGSVEDFAKTALRVIQEAMGMTEVTPVPVM
ncbi:hypothetical protein [Endothiovibrio diazotrophicus]